MAKITLIICLLSLTSISFAKYKHGQVCSFNSDCDGQMGCYKKYKGSDYDYRCGCKVGYGFTEQSSICTSFDLYQCTTDDQCQDSDRYRVCKEGKCTCKDKYQESSNKDCNKITVGHMESCDKDQDCKGELYCYPRTNKCICKQGYLWSSTNDDCKSMSSYQCSKDTDCQDRDPNRICSTKDDYCRCRDGYEAESSSYICTKLKNSYNESCNEDKECTETLKCFDVGFGNKKCQCKTGYFWKANYKSCYSMSSSNCQTDMQCQDRDPNRLCIASTCRCRPDYMENYNMVCEKKYGYRESCNSQSQCLSNLTCSSGDQCICTTGYIWSDKENRCKPFQDGSCTSDLLCQDHDNQRICNKTQGKCVCKLGMFADSKNKCNRQVALGAACNNTNECVTTNSLCHKATCNAPTGLCVCKPTHRRSASLCVVHTCTQSSDCYSNIFDEDDHLICDRNGQCNCQSGYAVDLVEGRCRNTGTPGHKSSFASSIQFNYFFTFFIILISIIKLI